MVVGKVVVDAHLLQGSNDTWFGGSADNRHRVSGLFETFQLLRCSGARLALLSEFGSDGTKLFVDVFLELISGHLEVVLLLQADHHATEVLTDEVLKESFDGVALRDFVHLKEFIGEIGAGFKGQTLGEAESVVAVKEDVLDLYEGIMLA